MDVPAPELYVYVLFAVLFVSTALFPTIRSARGDYYRSLKRPRWALPRLWLVALVALVVWVLVAWSVFRIRAMGAWESGINLTELLLVTFLHFLQGLAAFAFFELGSPVVASVVVFLTLVLSFIVSWLFTVADTLAGVFMWVQFAWLIYVFTVVLAMALMNGGAQKAARGITRSQLRMKRGGIVNKRI